MQVHEKMQVNGKIQCKNVARTAAALCSFPQMRLRRRARLRDVVQLGNLPPVIELGLLRREPIDEIVSLFRSQ
jgi:hypothetical protein